MFPCAKAPPVKSDTGGSGDENSLLFESHMCEMPEWRACSRACMKMNMGGDGR